MGMRGKISIRPRGSNARDGEFKWANQFLISVQLLGQARWECRLDSCQIVYDCLCSKVWMVTR